MISRGEREARAATHSTSLLCAALGEACGAIVGADHELARLRVQHGANLLVELLVRNGAICLT